MSKIYKIWIGIGSVIGVLSMIGGYYTLEERKRGDLEKYKEAQKEVTFKDSEQKHDVVDLLDIEFHPLKLSKTQDSLSSQLKKVDTLLSNTLKQKVIDAEVKKVQDSIENLRAIKTQKNRDKKYKLQADMFDAMVLIKVELRKMNLRLDSLKN